MEEFNTILDYFEEKYNSKQWPSDDPEDSPFNDFKCKLCGWAFREQIFGRFSIYDDPPYLKVQRKIVEHLAVRHNINIPLDLDNLKSKPTWGRVCE